MSSDSSEDIVDTEVEGWEEDGEAAPVVAPSKYLDSRRMVENKLEDLRLARELSEFNFGF